jgi:hypothetical protein
MSPNRCTSKPVTHIQAMAPTAAPAMSGLRHAQTATAQATVTNGSCQGSRPITTAITKTHALPPASDHADDSRRVIAAS